MFMRHVPSNASSYDGVKRHLAQDDLSNEHSAVSIQPKQCRVPGTEYRERNNVFEPRRDTKGHEGLIVLLEGCSGSMQGIGGQVVFSDCAALVD